MTHTRRQSDLTVPIDRALLPPISTKNLADLDLDPDSPESQALIAEAKTRPTMVPCPMCIECPCCSDMRMVTPKRAVQYEDALARIEILDTPDDDGPGEAA